MTQRALQTLAASGLFVALTLVAPSPLAAAQGNDPPPKVVPAAEKTAAEKAAAKKAAAEKAAVRKVLEAVALDFQNERTAKLIERIPEKATLTLTLGTANNDRLKRPAAKQVLQAWFDAKEVRKVGLTKHKGLVGVFDISYRPKGNDDVKKRKLDIELRLSETGTTYVLQRIELHRK